MSEVEQKIRAYVERFNECVPVFQMPTVSDEELMAVIDESLKSGKPVEVEQRDDVDY